MNTLTLSTGRVIPLADVRLDVASQLFPNGGTVDLNNGNPSDVDFTLPVVTAIGQFTNRTVYSSYGTQCVTPHDITFESV